MTKCAWGAIKWISFGVASVRMTSVRTLCTNSYTAAPHDSKTGQLELQTQHV